MLRRYDASGYTGQDRLSYDIFDYFVDMQVRGEPWRYHNYPVNQMFGVQSDLPNLMTQAQQVNDATDAEHYIARLGEFPGKFEQVIEGIKLRESKGIVPPKFVVEKVLEQIKGFLAPGAERQHADRKLQGKARQDPGGQDGCGDARRAAGPRGARCGDERDPGVRGAGRVPRNAAAEGDAQRWRMGAAGRRPVLRVRDRVQHHDQDGRGRDPRARAWRKWRGSAPRWTDPQRRRLHRRHAAASACSKLGKVAGAALSGHR